MNREWEETFRHALQILPGLLASGHYTKISEDDGRPLTIDDETDGSADAITDAISMAHELRERCEEMSAWKAARDNEARR